MSNYESVYLKPEHKRIILEALTMLEMFRAGDANAAGTLAEDYYFKDRELYEEASQAETELAISIEDIRELKLLFQTEIRREKE